MERRTGTALLAALTLLSGAFRATQAQATATAARSLGLSAFAGVSGIYTGLNSAKNLSFTAGGDISLRNYYGLHPAVEVRGSYPIDSGNLVSEKNILGGLRISHRLNRFTVYGDALAGRGELVYLNGYIDPTGTIEYLQNPTNVYSGGGGVELRLNDRFGLKADAQFQHYGTPVTTSGHIYSKPLTLAVVYHFSFGDYPLR